MVHTLQIVDSVASSPTVRLDLNDGTTWRCLSFDEGVAKLRRAASANAMRDGINVSSSQYDARSPNARLQVFGASRDLAATQIQLLSRELDRTDNFLKYQQSGSSKPVFFKLFRSDYAGASDIRGQSSAYEIDVDFLAEPFMLGLMETLGPYTVNNDPAAGSNGCYFDVTGVIGDVAAPALLVDSTANMPIAWLGVRQHGTPSSLTFWAQAESMTLGTDTTNPGGGPDAAMSGTGTNNYVRTSFGTTSMATRLTWAVPDATTSTAAGLALRGTYRVLACVRRSDGTSVIRARLLGGSSVAVPLSTNRQLVDLGLWSAAPPARPGGYAPEVPVAAGGGVAVEAERVSGSGTLDWDFLALVPADESLLVVDHAGEIRDTSLDTVIDSFNEVFTRFVSGTGSVVDGTADMTEGNIIGVSGAFPYLVPNQTNRAFLFTGEYDMGATRKCDKSVTESITVYYWPAYLFVRPSAT